MVNTTGPVFQRLQAQLADHALMGEYLDVCNRTVDKLLAEQTLSSKPGMLLGKIQSGKTKSFVGALALAFDNGFDHAVIFTKGTKALARQTLARLRKDLKRAIDDEIVGVHDIMTLPDTLATRHGPAARPHVRLPCQGRPGRDEVLHHRCHLLAYGHHPPVRLGAA